MGKKYSKNTNNIKYVIKYLEGPNLDEPKNIDQTYLNDQVKMFK